MQNVADPNTLLSYGADYGAGGHRYNDDLLLSVEAQERAALEHAAVYHVLDHPELRAAFRKSNESANLAKRYSHVAGFWAVAAAFVALSTAAGEPLWANLASPWPRMIAIASALLGILSFFLSAVWVMFGKRKSEWLYDRLHTERLRQFHFQSFIWHLPEIAESLRLGENGKREYRTTRDQWFKALESESANDTSQMSAILDHTATPKIWLHSNASIGEDPVVPNVSAADLQPVFRAYEVFRFDEQEAYAGFMLRKENKPEMGRSNTSDHRWLWYPGIKQPLRVKRTVLTTVWKLALFVLIVMHLGILATHILDRHWFEGWLAHIPIWVALLAVAVKTLSEGLSLTGEIERYEEYRIVVSTLKNAFNLADTPQKKVQMMVSMEKAAFEEMRVFMRSHHEASFIM